MDSVSGVVRVMIAGGGTMGQEIAITCVHRGFEVSVFDANPQALQAAAQTKGIISQIERHDPAWIAERTRILNDLRVETNLAVASRGVDLVIESLPEKQSLKKEFFRQVSQLVPPAAILVTNSSMMTPSQLREGVLGPERFAALHFLNETKAAEIMGHDQTAPSVIERLELFVRQLAFYPLVCRIEKSGLLLNTMLTALNYTAMTLAADGAASVEDIDRAWALTCKTARGPFANLDMIGLDTARDITRFQASLTGDPQLKRVADFLEGYVQQGRLGVKTLRGFYTYPNPEYEQPGFVEPPTLPGPSPSVSASDSSRWGTSSIPMGKTRGGALLQAVDSADPETLSHHQCTLSPVHDGFLRDHVFKDTPLLPAAAIIEMLAEANDQFAADSPSIWLSDLRFENGVRCFTDDDVVVHLLQRADATGQPVWELRQEFRNRAGKLLDPRRLCATARPGQPWKPATSRPSAGDWPESAFRPVHYPAAGPNRLGPAMQGLQRLALSAHAGRGFIIATGDSARGPHRPPGAFRHSISVIDAALAACNLFTQERLNGLWQLPVAVAQLCVGRRPTVGETCRVQFVCQQLGPQESQFDVTVLDSTGETVLALQGYRCLLMKSAESAPMSWGPADLRPESAVGAAQRG
jgi:3-hydroxybutyryl-CoA dehydrogenase